MAYDSKETLLKKSMKYDSLNIKDYKNILFHKNQFIWQQSIFRFINKPNNENENIHETPVQTSKNTFSRLTPGVSKIPNNSKSISSLNNRLKCKQ